MGCHGLSDAEYDLMQLFWDKNEVQTLNDVIAHMQTLGHTWKQQTAHTVLSKLITKGVLHSEKKGFRKYYSRQLSREEYLSQWTRGVVERDYGGSLTGFLTAFTGGKSLTKEEAEELHKFLDQQ